MDDHRFRSYFLHPIDPVHRRYEALRAFFVDGRSWTEIAAQFGFEVKTLKSMASRFRQQCSQESATPFFEGARAVVPPR